MSNLKRILAALGVFALSSAAFAAPAGTRNDGSRTLRLSETTEILGTPIPAGSYSVKWARETGTEAVRLEVTRGRQVLATGQGVWATASPSQSDALVFRNSAKATELTEIRFRNSSERLLLRGVAELSSSATAPAR